jgi:hypothetical protein
MAKRKLVTVWVGARFIYDVEEKAAPGKRETKAVVQGGVSREALYLYVIV